ncbi:histone-lysine N-methyltransferase SETD7 isoform X2 [Eurytemora carolleeae]|uniref:histone-lysine N-methyltransferase SETD7 isoform X2 n=1 Tax=Eurytemora carolleeae TaxID=1294199 RepID=UPI000C76B060|nr:histone-lysine N-methyltransferase SETD7 isoform X2 [Eurytemora carolleeae]|eukprot:XP_023336315.1 histone-lysine N-methyltransferase SETD7-like isoform X2 [Eurytemora affinis]
MLTGEWFEGVYKDGERQGFFREFGIDNHLKEFTRYQRNKRVGWTYEGKLGGGYLIGLLDHDGKMTGDNIIYMYPDFRTGLRGSFQDGVMISAQLSTILSSEEVDGVCIPVLSEPKSEDIYFFDPATSTRISRQPLLQDPWERSLVEVKMSKLDQAGHGLFAREEIPKKTVVALFAGIRLKEHQLAKHKKSNYRIILNSAINLDIPQDCICISNYCATLAHKANHSFTPNSEWSIFEHPRFGLIRAISAKQDIQVGEEILVNYNIELSTAPEWYRILWLRIWIQREEEEMERGTTSTPCSCFNKNKNIIGLRKNFIMKKKLKKPCCRFYFRLCNLNNA